MTMYRNAHDVIRHVIEQRGRFLGYVGAGVSAEAQPPIRIADSICADLRRRLLEAEELEAGRDDDRIAALDKKLRWDESGERYFSCIREALPNQQSRVSYFRQLSEHSRPGFCHHGIALLMRHGVLKQTCLTTNFDKLLESAFTLQGALECQPIRTDEEAEFWDPESKRKFFIVKLHGDYDTHNIVNTKEETLRIRDSLRGIAGALVSRAGLLVLGTAGYEQSIRRLFEDFALEAKEGKRTLSVALFWGVYMGERDPGPLSEAELEQRLKQRIESGVVSPHIVGAMEMLRSKNELVSFFPVWSSGGFVFDLIRRTGSRGLLATAELLLDHPMRMTNVFRAKGLSPQAIDDHLRELNQRRLKLAGPVAASELPKQALEVLPEGPGPTIRLLYGDITSRSYMGAEEFASRRRGVVSAEDTFLSAGGGVALTLLQKAGEYKILNELGKFAPIAQGKVAVTSGGDLPVHHLLHAAAIEVSERDGKVAYSATPETVRRTMTEILAKARALEVDALWVPLMGTGLAKVPVDESLGAILKAIAEHAAEHAGALILLFVYKEEQLRRDQARGCLEAALGPGYKVSA